MIFVTGASGNVGTAVVEHLRDRQLPCRVGSRKANVLTIENGVEIVPFDFLKPTTYATAVQGCHAVFLLRPPAIADTRQTLNVFLDVARTQGVEQVVFISVAGAADNPMVPHHAVEQHLQRDAAGWTILRPGFFAQNLGDAYRDDILADDRLYVPAGSGRVAFIDARDIAEVAVQILADPTSHQAQSYTLTGSEAITFTQVANLLTEMLERPIRYQPASIWGYITHLKRQRRLPIAQTLVQTVLHVGLRFGQAETVDDTLAHLLKHQPRTMRDYIQDYRSLWLKT